MRQRIRQFAGASRKPGDADIRLAMDWLNGPLLTLFLRQHPRDIVHTAATARWLLDRGHADPDLVVAALLHDTGKGDQRTRDRVAYVLASWAGIADRLASARSRFRMRRAIARSLVHAVTGARMTERAGAPARVSDLIARHHDPVGPDAMLGLLQEADSQN